MDAQPPRFPHDPNEFSGMDSRSKHFILRRMGPEKRDLMAKLMYRCQSLEELENSLIGANGESLDFLRLLQLVYTKPRGDCVIFEKPGRERYLQEVQDQVTVMVDSIFSDWVKLKGVMEVYAGVVQRRWSKKAANKREAILLEAWPEMPPRHRPDFEAFRWQHKGPEYRNCWLMPYVNLEDLKSSNNLQIFLQSRIRAEPDQFAWSDAAPVEMAVVMNAVPFSLSTGYTMRLSGQGSRTTYGTLVSWKDDPHSRKDIELGIGTHPSEGLMVLEIQANLYRFLLRCTELILPDIDLSAPALTKLTRNSKPNNGTDSQLILSVPSEWLSISKLNAEVAYHLPQKLPIHLLRKMAKAKYEEAEDAFWALREDPFQFQQALKESYKREIEIPNRTLQTIGLVLPAEGSAPMQCACEGLVDKSCRDLILWHALLKDLEELEELTPDLDLHVRLLEALPSGYIDAFTKLGALVDSVMNYVYIDLFIALTSCPEFLRFYAITTREKTGHMDFRLLDLSMKDLPQIFRFFFDFNDEERSETMGPLNILDEIGRIMENDPEQSAMVNASVARELSETAAVTQLQVALERHQPRILPSEDYEAISERAKEKTSMIGIIGGLVSGMKVASFAGPESAFKYPVEAKYSQRKINQMRLAEGKLDAFWKNVDDHFMRRTGKTIQRLLGDRLKARDLRRTQPWQPREEFLAKGSATNLIGPHPESYQFAFHETSKSSAELKTEPRLKPKTRGQADPPQNILYAEATDIVQDAQPQNQSFSLNRKLFKTMSRFFPSTFEDRLAKTVIWEDFLHAMSGLNFRIEKRHGSEWYFEPTWKKNSPITIHAPHPSHEIPGPVLRFMGSRLARKYGWTSETFQMA